jgi:hypothetical protein
MLGFPMVLGLLLRPGWPTLLLAGAALAAFLARPPLRRVITGQRDGDGQLRALLLLVGLALLATGTTLFISGPRFLIPALAVTPLLILALWADARRTVRSFAVEWSAQGAFAGLAAAMVVAGGGTLLESAWAWLFTLLVGGANLAHVRRLLGHARQLDAIELRRRLLIVHALHLLLLATSLALLAPRGLAGRLWTGWTLLLYLRALAPYRPLPARTLGWREGGLSVIGLLLLWRALL